LVQFLSGEKPAELDLVLCREVEKENAGSVGEFWLVLKIDDLSFGVNGTTVHHHREVVDLSLEQYGTALNLHPTQTEICCLS
jgi:hypothetical protein